MGVHYVTHIGSWDSSQTKVWHLPTAEMYNNEYWGSGNTALSAAQIEELAPKAQLDYTYICRADTAAQASAFGFTDIMDVSVWSGQKFYTDANTAFSFSMNGNVIRITVYKNGAVLSNNDQTSTTYLITPQMPGDFSGNSKRSLSCSLKATNPVRFGNFYTGRLADGYEQWPDPTPEPPADTDPYADGGYSGDGGGDAGFDLQNDSIDFPNVPTLSAVDTGLVSIYTPDLTQLKSLATFLWNANPTDVDWWKKLVANPLDLILGLSIVPVEVPRGTAQTIKVGLIDTGVSVTKAARQFVTVDCGSITIQKNCGGSALDFSPFTKFSLYLPFIGTRTISTDDIMGRTVHVKYNVDLLSGGCTAMVKITGGPEDNELDAILYQYSGACAISIPLTGETFTNMITSTIQLAASIGATVATGGAAAGVSAASAANSLMSMKPIIERAGGVSGAAGQLGIMKPYLIAEVPRQSVPANCNQFTGYPSNMKATIGDLTGYTEVDIIYLKGIEATQAELDELETILKGGFII